MAMAGVAIAEREIRGERVQVEADDNVPCDGLRREHLCCRHDRLHPAAVPLRGDRGLRERGTIQMVGEDWAPRGCELWQNGVGAWQVYENIDPGWTWTDGLRHMVECFAGAPP